MFLIFGFTAFTIVLLMFFLLILIGLAQNRLLQPLRSSPKQIKRGSGLVLILVGSWLLILAIWADAFSRFFPV